MDKLLELWKGMQEDVKHVKRVKVNRAGKVVNYCQVEWDFELSLGLCSYEPFDQNTLKQDLCEYIFCLHSSLLIFVEFETIYPNFITYFFP